MTCKQGITYNMGLIGADSPLKSVHLLLILLVTSVVILGLSYLSETSQRIQLQQELAMLQRQSHHVMAERSVIRSRASKLQELMEKQNNEIKKMEETFSFNAEQLSTKFLNEKTDLLKTISAKDEAIKNLKYEYENLRQRYEALRSEMQQFEKTQSTLLEKFSIQSTQCMKVISMVSELCDQRKGNKSRKISVSNSTEDSLLKVFSMRQQSFPVKNQTQEMSLMSNSRTANTTENQDISLGVKQEAGSNKESGDKTEKLPPQANENKGANLVVEQEDQSEDTKAMIILKHLENENTENIEDEDIEDEDIQDLSQEFTDEENNKNVLENKDIVEPGKEKQLQPKSNETQLIVHEDQSENEKTKNNGKELENEKPKHIEEKYIPNLIKELTNKENNKDILIKKEIGEPGKETKLQAEINKTNLVFVQEAKSENEKPKKTEKKDIPDLTKEVVTIKKEIEQPGNKKTLLSKTNETTMSVMQETKLENKNAKKIEKTDIPELTKELTNKDYNIDILIKKEIGEPEKDKTLQPNTNITSLVVVQTKKTKNTREDLENDKTNNTREDLKNEKTKNTKEDLENDKTNNTREDLKKENTKNTKEDLENDKTNNTREDLENEKSKALTNEKKRNDILTNNEILEPGKNILQPTSKKFQEKEDNNEFTGEKRDQKEEAATAKLSSHTDGTKVKEKQINEKEKEILQNAKTENAPSLRETQDSMHKHDKVINIKSELKGITEEAKETALNNQNLYLTKQSAKESKTDIDDILEEMEESNK